MITSDPSFLAAMRKLPCIACGGIYGVEAHHIQTRSRLGGDDPWNIIPLCSDDHTQAEHAWHRNIGRFFKRYPHVKGHLVKLGWTFDGNRLIHKAYRDRKPKQAPQYEIGSRGADE